MPETDTAEKKADQPKGFDKPLPKNHPGRLPDHIAEDTRMAKGVDPDTKQIVTVNLETLQAKFGKKDGLDRYTRIAKAGGFYDPSTEPVGSSFYPDLALEGMDKDRRTEVDAILNEKE